MNVAPVFPCVKLWNVYLNISPEPPLTEVSRKWVNYPLHEKHFGLGIFLHFHFSSSEVFCAAVCEASGLV